LDLEARVVEPKNSWQDLGGEPSRDAPAVWFAKVFGEFVAVFDRDGSSKVGMDEQLVLGEETSKQQTVPLFVGAVGDEEVDSFARVAQLARLRAQSPAQASLIVGQVGWWALGRDRKEANCSVSGMFGREATGDTSVFKELALRA
jgi:hypothetical protein